MGAHLEETVEILEWVARRGRRADGKERVRRIPAAGCNDRATQPAALLPRALQGCCGFWRWPALLAWPRSLRISALRFAPWPTPKSTATRPIPVFQQSPRAFRRQMSTLSDRLRRGFVPQVGCGPHHCGEPQTPSSRNRIAALRPPQAEEAAMF